MICGTTNVGIDTPKYSGLYAVEVFCGWKLLNWSEAQGWHMPGICKWSADIPLQWVGPLPALKRGQNPKVEFDL